MSLIASGSIARAQAPGVRLIAAANVTVRQTPSSDAPAVARLPLGAEVQEAGDADLDRSWVHIQTPDGKDGWVMARLTRPLDSFWTAYNEPGGRADGLGRRLEDSRGVRGRHAGP